MPSIARQSASSFVVSTATFDDFMPDETLITLGIEGRPFTVISRWNAPSDAADPALAAVTPDGLLRVFASGATTGAGWFEDTVPIPELAGATITRIVGLGSHFYPDYLNILVAAITSAREPVLVAVQKLKGAWARLDLPLDRARGADMAAIFVEASDVGAIAQQDGTIILYGTREGMPPIAFAFAPGVAVEYGVTGTYCEIGHYVALDGELSGLLQVEGDRMTLAPVRQRPLEPGLPVLICEPVGGPSMVPMPFSRLRDASQIVPLADGDGVCRGVVIRSNDGVLAYVPVSEGGRLEQPQMLDAVGDRPEGVVEAVASRDSQGTAHVFARDQGARIWHTQWNANTLATQLSWESIGRRGRALDAPEMVPGTPGILFQGLNGHAQHAVRTVDGDWVTRDIAVGRPDSEPAAATVHAIQISTVTAQSAVVADTPLQIRADRRIVVEHEGQLLALDPVMPTTLASNQMGSVRLKMRAGGLEAPVLTITYPEGGAAPARFRPQDGALRRLAGLDPRFAVDGESMQRAGLIPGDVAPADAARIADTVRAAARAAFSEGSEQPMQFQRRRQLAAAGEADTGPVAVAICRDGSRATVSDVTPQRRGRSVRDLRATSSSVWSDFWGFVTGAWEKVKEIVVTVVDRVVQIAVTIGDKVKSFLAETARRIGEGLEAVLGWLNNLGEQVKDAAIAVRDWVSEKLGWDEVVRFKNVVRAHALQSLVDLERVVGSTIPDAISHQLGRLKTQVRDSIDSAANRLSGQAPRLGSDAHNSSANAKLQSEGATILTVQHSVPSHSSSPELFTPSAALLAKLETLKADAVALTGNSAVTAGVDTISRMLSGGLSLEGGIPLLLGDLLRAMKDVAILAIDTVDVVQTAIFEMVGDLIAFARKVITTPILSLGSGFRWVNAVYRQISGGNDLDMLDLAALMFAAPGVILHQIFVGTSLVSRQIAPPATMFGLLGDKLAAEPGALVTTAEHPAVKFFNDCERPYQICTGIAMAVRSRVSVIEDATRYAETASGGMPVSRLISVPLIVLCLIDLLLAFWQVAVVVVSAVINRAAEYSDELTLVVFVVSVIIALAPLAKLIRIKLSDRTAVLAEGLFAFLASIPTLAFSLSNIMTFDDSTSSPDERTNFYLTSAADIVMDVQGFVQFAIPVAGEMKDPIVGGSIALIAATANSFCFLAAGALTLTEAFETPHEA